MNALKLHLPRVMALLAMVCAQTVSAQSMPQDTWRADGWEQASPTTANGLQSIGIGSTGIFAGETVSGVPTRVLRFTEAAGFVSRFEATFGYILGIQVDSAGEIYVLDRADSRVKVYNASGTYLRGWGGAGSGDSQFNLTGQTSYNLLGISLDNEIYVADPGNSRVKIFDRNGNFLRKWGESGNLPGQFSSGYPRSIAVSPDGRVYTDGKTFNKDGVFEKETWGGGYPGFACSPDGLVVYQVSSYLYYGNATGSTGGYIASGTTGHGAFSKEGKFFQIWDRKIRRWVREYDSAQNFLNPTPLPQPLILSASQRPGVSLVDVKYKVTDTDSPTVRTGLLAFKDSSNYFMNCVPMRTFVEGTAGNVGPNQPVDTERSVVWNMAADWAIDYANIRVEVLAKDERNLMGVHWITVPASGGQPAIQVSHRPILDADFEDLWFWFLATGQEVTVDTSTGVISANTGIFNGQKFTQPYSPSYPNVTTAVGRLFAAKKMGARPISEAELTRARAGLYGFQSLAAETLVKDETAISSLVTAWGSNSYGESEWRAFTTNNPVKIAAGMYHVLLLRGDGSLWGYGYSGNGELGPSGIQRSPVQIADGVSQISAGANHSLFVKSDGTLWAMGGNGYGQLGNGTTTPSYVPVQVATNVASVSAGTSHSLYVKTDGTLWAMGYNGYGQLGRGNNTSASTPVQIATGVAGASAGEMHSLFVKTDGTLWAMGNNGYGEFGNGITGSNSNVPVQAMSGVSQASAGTSYSLFLKTNGTVWAAGYNNYGQLGTGNLASASTPVQVNTGTGAVVGLAAKQYHSLFLKADATLWGMGYNSDGRLNDGTTINRSSPVQLGSNMAGFAAGNSSSVGIQLVTP